MNNYKEEKNFINKNLYKIPEIIEYKSFPFSAEELKKYNKLYNKGAEIILKDFERMSKLKIEYNIKYLEAKIKIDKLSQWQGFFISVLMIVGAVICGILQQAIIGSALAGATTLGIIKAILPKK